VRGNSHSLAGYRVGVTADRRADEQAQLLRRHGAEVLLGPTVRTVPFRDDGQTLDATLRVLERPPDVVVCMTGLGVRTWFETAESFELADELTEVLERATLVVRGPKAAAALHAIGLTADEVVIPATSSTVIEYLRQHGVSGSRLAVQLDGDPAAPVIGELETLGALVEPVPVYGWTVPEDPAPAVHLISEACEGRLDAITFTSRPSVWNLAAIARQHGRYAELRAAMSERVTVVGVGPVSAEAACELTASRVIQPVRHRLGSMVRALAEHLSGRARVLRANGAELRWQGRSLISGDNAVSLSDRELAVLEALWRGAGTVVPKHELLRTVWGPTVNDAHLVEVTVSRLRQRLGPAGECIETVVRRGYRLGVG
jgi:uroporphyrinogen-III synthase